MVIWKKTYLYVQIIYVIKEIFNSIFLSDIMEHNKPYMCSKKLRKTLFYFLSVTENPQCLPHYSAKEIGIMYCGCIK